MESQDVIIPSTQKPKSNFLFPIFIFLILLLSFSLIYFGYHFSLSQKEKQPSQENTLNPIEISPTPTKVVSSETDDWKVYISKNNIFAVSYPPSWKIDDSNRVEFYDPYTEVWLSSHSTSDKQYVEEHWLSSYCGGEGNGCLLVPNKENKKFEFNGIEMYWKIDGNDQIYVFIPNQSKNLTIEMSGPGKNKTVINKMISTFKFLPSASENPKGKFCGGIAANLPENQCPQGYRCQLDGNYPDASGKCEKE